LDITKWKKALDDCLDITDREALKKSIESVYLEMAIEYSNQDIIHSQECLRYCLRTLNDNTYDKVFLQAAIIPLDVLISKG
jgi:hypothetical protein